MRPHGRVDANQAEIVQALRSVGAGVCSLADLGHGVPDLLVCYRRHLFLIEVKAPKGELTPDERAWHALWPVSVARSIEDALRVVGADLTEGGDE